MPRIQRILVANHTHHDIGFNDYQDVAFRQHGEFVRGALDLIEATAAEDPANQYRWVCEVTGPLVKYLRKAGPAEVERFRYWQERGAIDVAAMQYNLTPLLSPEQMRRSLYPVRELREEMGITVETAMQDDVNGVSWLFADLLPAIGVDFLTMAINQSRGRAPRPFPGGFWWEGPAGNRLLTWNGFHYLFGRSQAKLGDWRFVDSSLPYYLDRLEQDEAFPYDFLYCESTHPMRVDNGPPDAKMAQFVREWNDQGRTPTIEFTTPRLFRDELKKGWAADLPVWRGDWTDWWSDGAASSAYETGMNRATHEVLAAAEVLAAWLIADGKSPDLAQDFVEQVYEAMTLYDEHTWGAFSSIDAPESLFSKAQWNRKANFGYQAAMESHDMLTRSARSLAADRGERLAEGRFNLGDLDPEDAYPTDPEAQLLVINTLPHERTVNVEVPEFRSGGAPAGMLEGFFPRDVPWGGPPHTAIERLRVTVPGFGYAFADPAAPIPGDDLVADGLRIENEFYRVEIDPATGTISSWYDKALEHDFADRMQEGGLGGYVHEIVDSEKGRDALYLQDFGSWDFGYWQADPPFQRSGPTAVTCAPARIEAGTALIDVTIEARGVRKAVCRIALPSRSPVLEVDWLLDKTPQTDPESVYVLFPVRLDGQDYTVDLNGIPIRPNEDQLPGVVFDWYPIRRWADVSDGRHGVTLVALDAPLVQLGGITTNKIAERLEPERPAIVSWPLNNHWMVNFKASQEGEIPLRYRLTTHPGGCDIAAANRFAEEQAVAPVVLRDYRPTGASSGSLLEVPSVPGLEVHLKPATYGDGLIVRIRNITDGAIALPLDAFRTLGTVSAVGALEEDLAEGVQEVPAFGEVGLRITLGD
ncbi:glycoside hydrolase family 38 C-terminal domain-containing protein [Naasia sp. SYSU D00057]|uniref:glycoside hydrolase family 38 N-terminal domain-containing protein n=1 Tax=Naasia sp. SYSU D00057 TaxID=2817380 RepID=UPI001B312C4F|nr:glycoside hydrolase family 38 C-terminal domain-containing protein [Naasia sp. SYSU D00057]